MRNISKHDFTPIESYFTYDFAKDSWIKQDAPWQNDELRKQDIALFFHAAGYICGLETEDSVPMMWCAKHNAYEHCQDNGTTDRGCHPGRFQCCTAGIYPSQSYMLGKSFPVLWCIKQADTEGTLVVTVQTITVKLPKALRNCS